MGLAAGQVLVDTDTSRITALENARYSVTQRLTGSAANVRFTGISSSLRRLRITYTVRGDKAAISAWMYLRINDNAGSTQYRWAMNEMSAASAAPFKVATIDTGQIVVGTIAGANATSGIFASGAIDIPAWDAPHTNYLGVNFTSQMFHDASSWWIDLGGGQYKGAGPYTTVTLLPEVGNFVAGSEFTLTGEL